ncbi:FecR domain-containing protein [Rapidithrix thailandica]|uniref:FecR domain-containing protein n=1 Tax=Rapidithrix thailandica TaxID=413964 RepID=A0AAW9RRT1_9BACT
MFEEIEHLIAKTLAGEATEEEEQQLSAWLLVDTKNQQAYQMLRAYWNIRETKRGRKRHWLKLQKDILAMEKVSVPVYSKRKSPASIWWRYAAIWLGLMLTSLSIWWFNAEQPVVQVPEVQTIAMVEKVVPKGQKLTVKLPDGTLVKLNSESKLTFPERFGEQLRQVHLQGEAFFEVQKDTTRPFRIVSREVTTTVLGTSFDINAYPENSGVQVAVLTGKVKVEQQQAGSVVLTPREMARVEAKHITKATFDPDKLFAWKDNRLVFEKASLSEVIKILERWYGCNFALGENTQLTKARLYTAVFVEESLEVVLQNLNYSYELNFILDPRTKTVNVINPQT